MDMLFDTEKNEYYCIRCSFTGSEEEVQIRNAETRRRYSDRRVRITDFGPRTEKPSDAAIKKAITIKPVSSSNSNEDIKMRKT